MSDNVDVQSTLVATLPAGTKIAARSVTYSGDAGALIAPVSLVKFSGSDDAKVVTDINPATEDKQDTANTSLASLDGKITAVNTGAVVVASSALPTGAATAANQASEATLIGAVTETAPASDTASSGLNGRLQRIAQRLTSLMGLLPTALGANGGLKIEGVASGTVVPVADGGGSLTIDGSVSVSGLVPGVSATSLGKAEDAVAADGDTGVMALAVRKDVAASLVGADGDYAPLEVDANGRLHVNGSGVTQPVSAASLPLPTGASTETTLGTRLSESDFDSKAGGLTEAAPASDTASSGLNGRLQRIAQRLTTLLAVFPTTIDTNSGNKSASTLRVTLATDQVQLTNALKVDGSAVTQPISRAAVAVAAAVTSVNDAATNQTLLSSNASRKGYKLYNDSTQTAYVKEGTTATTADYSYQLSPNAFYESIGEACYTGRIDCIWAADASGAMKVTELS